MSDIKLTKAQEEVLRSQVFDAAHPGAVLHDFALVLDYVAEKGVKAGGKYNLLPIDAIPVLDPRLAHPLRLQLERPQLRSHPYLQGLHLLLRSTSLARVEGKGDKARLVIDPETLESWNELNPTEQYFSLLEAWLLVSRPEMVGVQDRFGRPVLEGWAITLRLLMGPRRKALRGRVAEALFLPGLELYPLALADLFGLVTVRHPPGSVKAWVPAAMQLTPFGDAFLTLLASALGQRNKEGAEEEVDEDEAAEEGEGEMVEFGQLQSLLEPYFPAYQNALTPASAPPAREGVFVFKVSLGKEVWRRIALGHTHTLHDLLLAILRSVDFDYDHLYEFRYRDALGRTAEATHPECDDGVPADTVELGTLPLKPGESMSLVYDFGDNWRFSVKLERIDPPGSVKKLPKVLESHGKAPEQYPSWD
jgi:hypothetical protein